MPFQSTESEEPSHLHPPRAARLTGQEMEDVIALWQQEQGLSERPRAEDVAEGLNVPVSEVERLLQIVRAQRAEEEKRLAKEQAKLETETHRVRAEREMLANLRRQRVQVRGQTKRLRVRRQGSAFGDLFVFLLLLAVFGSLFAVTMGVTVLAIAFPFSGIKSWGGWLVELCFIAADIGLWRLNWHYWKEFWAERRR